jgi:glycosyltransferase involved in cell wall biosynthesis
MRINDGLKLPWEEIAQCRLADPDLPRLGPGVGLTVMFPAYNDAETIGTLVEYSAALLPRVADSYEIVVVNDASSDETGAVLAELQTRIPFLRVVTHETNQNYGGALRSGFAHGTKSLLFYTDGDGQYDPTELVELLPHIDPCGMVNGYKISRSDDWYRIVIGRAYHHTAKRMFGLRIRDVDCDFRLIRREALDRIHLTSVQGSICAEMVRKIQDAGYAIVEVPVHHYERMSGESQFFTPRRIARSLLWLSKLWTEIVLFPNLSRLWGRPPLPRETAPGDGRLPGRQAIVKGPRRS